ncbi:hypothetical protein [uncultured Streptococcus sp.]|uniref:hypothetical protein n=1 Tax=uncultured Streptococcus sp. TaxID=83427 RepID=UPI00262529CD|nr:hypothetical protein [uncultured Streptococcus sp.]
MPKYKLLAYFEDGEIVEEDNFGNYFDTEDDARYAISEFENNMSVGAEVLHLSDPFEYPDEEAEQAVSYEIVEVD